MAFSSFVSSAKMFKQLNDFWHIPGKIKDMTIRLEFDQTVSVDITHIVKNAEASKLVETLSAYQLIPTQPWTWLAKVLPDNAKAPLCVEWDPAAFPPDDEAPTVYWTWDGRTVELCEWYLGSWRNMDGTSMVFRTDPRLVVAWQPLPVPPAPVAKKDSI